MGYLGLLVPEAAGGQGLGPIELAIVCEEIGRVCAPGPYLDVGLAASLLAAAGGQDALVADVAAGRRLVVIAREDALFAGQQGEGVRVESGRLRGTKVFVPFAAAADALAVTAPDGDPSRHRAVRGRPPRDVRPGAALRPGPVRPRGRAARRARAARHGRSAGAVGPRPSCSAS